MTNESPFRTYRGRSWITRACGFETTTHHDYIEARFPLETRRVAWSDIQDFEISRNMFSGEFVVVRLNSGRRLALPNIDSRSVASVKNEVQALRELWEQLRGPDWTPLQR
ncbi:PH domain-containing protein [Streptomyces sp. NPDC093591]|uniref:PH domain-containing protein n=1 Tax=Streptomyces sp. NPDC093591 TaxID=3366044 RepID=UPI0037F58435